MTPEPGNQPRDKPRTLHFSSVVFLLLAHIRQSLFPIFVAMYSAIKGSWITLIVLGAIVGLVMLVVIVRFLTFRYRIADGELVVTEGLIFRKVRNVPVDRIQNVDLLQNVLHRILGVAEVRVETASGTKPEAILRVLSMKDVDKLRSEIFSTRGEAIPDHAEVDEATVNDQAPATEVILNIPTRWLVMAGLASNRGMIIVGILLGLFIQQDEGLVANADWFKDLLPAQANAVSMGVFVVAAAILALILIRSLGIAWYILRFHNYRLERTGDDFHLSCGLLTRVSATVPRRRIQFISIHRTPIQRMLKIASIRIETAGGAGNQNENAAATVTRRWFVPVISDDMISAVIGHLRPGLQFHEQDQPWQAFSPRAKRRVTRLGVVGAIAIAVIGFAAWQPWGWAAGLIGLIVLPPLMRLRLRHLAYARTDEAVVFRSGVWTQKTSLTFYDKIQNVKRHESPFDRRWGMSTVEIDTAASGPANHAINVRFLESETAQAEIRELANRSAQAQLVWQ